MILDLSCEKIHPSLTSTFSNRTATTQVSDIKVSAKQSVHACAYMILTQPTEITLITNVSQGSQAVHVHPHSLSDMQVYSFLFRFHFDMNCAGSIKNNGQTRTTSFSSVISPHSPEFGSCKIPSATRWYMHMYMSTCLCQPPVSLF